MQHLSPRQYFETRLRKLPIHKCLVNKGWEEGKLAMVTVIRNHVNGKVSGANFLVDLLCLGVKDVHCFFNTDEDEMTERLGEYNMHMIEIPYALAHNIVYAGLEFAAEYHIKPHADFAMAKYALEEDNDTIELIDIETGENGMPHLMENHPGQYADAHAKLKKHAGEGNFKISLFMHDEDEADWDDEDDDDEDGEWDDEDNDFSNNDDELDEAWEEKELSLEEIPNDELTLYDAMMLPPEDLENEELVKSRSEVEQIILFVETAVRVVEHLIDQIEELEANYNIDAAKIKQIRELEEKADNDFMHAVPYPNGCEEDEYDTGIEAFFENAETLTQLTSISQKAKLLKQIVQPQRITNSIALAYCMVYLLQEEGGKVLYETLLPFIGEKELLPLIALAQTYMVTADPDKFPYPPLITSNAVDLNEIFKDCYVFSTDEYCFFYALRSSQAAQQQDFPMAATWYRLMVETNDADTHSGMLFTLFNQMTTAAFNFINKHQSEL